LVLQGSLAVDAQIGHDVASVGNQQVGEVEVQVDVRGILPRVQRERHADGRDWTWQCDHKFAMQWELGLNLHMSVEAQVWQHAGCRAEEAATLAPNPVAVVLPPCSPRTYSQNIAW
jgi:hypothetical protein